jgi:hypothetical protein
LQELKLFCYRGTSYGDGVIITECDFGQGIWLETLDSGEQCFVNLSDIDAIKLYEWLGSYLMEKGR